jgi:hypothetical protein
METTPGSSLPQATVPEEKVPAEDSASIEKIKKLFHFTVLLILFVLLVSPVYTTYNNTNRGKDHVLTITGLSYSPVLEYSITDPLFILILGWLGIFTLSFSWFWFFGYFVLNKFIDGKITSKILTYLLVFFTGCLVTLPLAFRKGHILPYDIDCQCSFIGGYLSGYYIYIVLIMYLIFCSIFSLSSITTSSRLKYIKLSSVIAIIATVILTALFNPYVNSKIVNNKNAIAYRDQLNKEDSNIKEFTTALENHFNSDGSTSPHLLTFRYCETGPVISDAKGTPTCANSAIELGFDYAAYESKMMSQAFAGAQGVVSIQFDVPGKTPGTKEIGPGGETILYMPNRMAAAREVIEKELINHGAYVLDLKREYFGDPLDKKIKFNVAIWNLDGYSSTPRTGNLICEFKDGNVTCE